MKILTRQGEVELTANQLANYDRAARNELTKAKRARTLQLGEHTVHFKVAVRCTLPTEMQTLLRHVLNIRKHGKAYAPEEVNEAFERLHAQISRTQGLELPVQFDLRTGELTIDWPK